MRSIIRPDVALRALMWGGWGPLRSWSTPILVGMGPLLVALTFTVLLRALAALLVGTPKQTLADLPEVRGMGWSPPEIVLAGDTIVGVGWLRGVTGDVVIGTIERPGGDG